MVEERRKREREKEKEEKKKKRKKKKDEFIHHEKRKVHEDSRGLYEFYDSI